MACILTWIGEFSSPLESLTYIGERKGIQSELLTIPSQRRYVNYFANILAGVKPSSEPLLLRRVIINSIPNFNKNSLINDSNNTHNTNHTNQSLSGCCPYIQIFKCGKLIATAAPLAGTTESLSTSGHRVELKWVNCSEGSVSFNMDTACQVI